MAGYSGTSLIRKFGIKPGERVQFMNTTAGFELRELKRKLPLIAEN